MELRSPVYVIANAAAGGVDDALDVGRASVAGGAGLVQFRAKHDLSSAELRALTTFVAEAQAAGVPVVMNDLPELAAEIGAAGAHVGQSDAKAAAARAALGPEAIVGVTAPTPDEARAAAADGASYVAVGAMYPSPTKPDRPVVGPKRLREIVAAAGVPVCAIGGITAEHAPELLDAGAALLCVISAVSRAADRLGAVRELVRVCDDHAS